MGNALKSSIGRLASKLEDYKKDAQLLVVATGNLVPYAKQARTKFDEEALRELAESFKEVGILEPLLVRPIANNKFEIIAGERRLRAAIMAGLAGVPVLSRPMDDELADRIHLAENIHRENLSSLELAERVQRDLEEAGGDLAKVAAKYNKGKPWVSKLASIAGGGETMTVLVEEGVTADRAVLATVASLERKAPERAKALGEQLKAAPAKSNKRAIAEQFMKGERAAAPKAKPGKGPAAGSKHSGERPAATEEVPSWRTAEVMNRPESSAVLLVELSPHSMFADEFAALSKSFGAARLAMSVRHPHEGYAVVQFGEDGSQRQVYRADELRLLAVF